MNNSWVLLRRTHGSQLASSRVMLSKLHAWPRVKDRPLLSPQRGGAGAHHGAACEEHLSALLCATVALVSAVTDA